MCRSDFPIAYRPPTATPGARRLGQSFSLRIPRQAINDRNSIRPGAKEKSPTRMPEIESLRDSSVAALLRNDMQAGFLSFLSAKIGNQAKDWKSLA
jgi:hypothetical protein